MLEKLRRAGIDVTEPIAKVDSDKINLADKIDKARKFLNKAQKSYEMISDVSDRETAYEWGDSAVLNYQRYCEAIKDILTRICEHNQISLSEYKSLSEVIRKSHAILNTSSDMQNAINKLTDRNDSVHDYMNDGYYDDQIIRHLANDLEFYKRYLNIIFQYCQDNNLI